MKKMDNIFSHFCNICCKTTNDNLINICVDNNEYLKHILISIIRHDIMNDNAIYLCRLCREELLRLDKFRAICCNNLIKLREIINMKVKLGFQGNAATVTNMLKEFLHTELLRYNSIGQSNGICSKQIINLHSERNVLDNCSDISITNNINVNDSQIALLKNKELEYISPVNVKLEKDESENFVVSYINNSNDCDASQNEFAQGKLHTQIKMEDTTSENSALKYFISECNENVNFVFDTPDTNNSNACSTAQIQFTKEEFAKNNDMQNNSSQNIKLEKDLDRYDDCFAFDGTHINSSNLCSISQTQLTKELHTEIDIGNSAPEYFELKNIESISGEDTNCDFDVNISDSDDNLEILSTHVAQGNNTSNMENSVHRDIRSQVVRVGMELQSGVYTSKSRAGAVNTQQHSPQVHGQCNRSWPVLESVLNDAEPYKSVVVLHKCNICASTFREKHDLITHQRTHIRIKPYECDVCNKVISDSSNLIKHKRIHTGERPYKCNVCSKAYTTSSKLIIHKRTHTGEKPYKCNVCNKAFGNSSSLAAHRSVHRPERPYKCNVCNKDFKLTNTLNTHQRIHSDIRPHKCNLCNKAFTRADNLVKHKRIHSGEKPYKCTVCEKAFNNLSNLTTHKRIHNRVKP